MACPPAYPNGFKGAYAFDTSLAPSIKWKDDVHGKVGTVARADGSAQTATLEGLRRAVLDSDEGHNDYHLLLPY